MNCDTQLAAGTQVFKGKMTRELCQCLGGDKFSGGRGGNIGVAKIFAAVVHPWLRL